MIYQSLCLLHPQMKKLFFQENNIYCRFSLVITYIVVELPYSIFQTQYIFSARSPTYEMLRWAFFMDHDYICGLLNFPMSGLSLRTLRFEDWCSHLQSSYWCPTCINVSHWTNEGSDGCICMVMTQLLLYCGMVIIALILIFVTCINM